ncbi:MAG: transporter substrate-binding domain-containing protein [Holosporales bacterium]|jgi:membrane-bound lytic murein transglycosylase MltF|nr:transporter substrate-binding domain-containing protein [Holosporales bacterium]
MKIVKYLLWLGALIIVVSGISFRKNVMEMLLPSAIDVVDSSSSEAFLTPYKDIFYQFEKPQPEEDIDKQFGSLEDIVKRRELVICAIKNENNPCFQMKVDGGYIGEDVRLAQGFGEMLGVKVSYRMIYDTYDDVVDAIKRGEGDIGIAKLSYTPERCRKVLYTLPYVISRKTVLINRLVAEKYNSENLVGILDNEDATIAVMENTCYGSFAKSLFPKSKIKLEKKWENGLILKLIEGKIIAAIRDELRVNLLLHSNPNLLLRILPLVLKDEHDSIAAVINMKGGALVSFINKYLSSNYKISTSAQLMEKYKEYIK